MSASLPPRRVGRYRRPLVLAAALTTVTTLAACGDADGEPDEHSMRAEIVARHPHDPAAFTQGLEVDALTGPDTDPTAVVLLEGTGQSGKSWVARRTLADPTPSTRVDAGDLFGEGITAVGDTVWQLTWRDGTALARDRETLVERTRVDVDGEGWGVCSLDDRLVTSDGSDRLTFRDPVSFAPTGSVVVALDAPAPGGDPTTVSRLNELECASDGTVYANVWKTDTVVRIDPVDGRVVDTVDASVLRASLDTDERRGIDVLNGIAQIPGTDRFLLTGKYWPAIFEVRFLPSESG